MASRNILLPRSDFYLEGREMTLEDTRIDMEAECPTTYLHNALTILKRWLFRDYGIRSFFLDFHRTDPQWGRVYLYTSAYRYSLSVSLNADGSPRYLGGGVVSRKHNIGEDWVRGNDLPDGDFSEDTLRKIMYAILRYELRPMPEIPKLPYIKDEADVQQDAPVSS